MDDKSSVSEEERRQFEAQLNQASKTVGTASDDLRNASQGATQGLDKSVAALSGLGGGLVQFSKGLLNSQGNIGKIGESASSAGSSIGDALMSLGPFGFVIGALIKVISKVVGAVLGTDQKLLDNYDKLADLGGQTKFTTDSLRKLAEQTGQTLQGDYFDKLVNTTKSLGTTLLTLGKTSGDGMEAFMQVAKYSKETAHELNNLGINYEKFNQIQADYLTLQSKLGLQRGKSISDLAKESKAYALGLVELAAVTGLSTEELRKRQQQEMDDFAWNLKMREMSTTDEGKKRAEMLNNYIVRVREQFGDLDANALRNILSTGFATSKESSAVMNRYAIAGLDFQQMVRKLEKDGKIEDYLLKGQEANKKSLDIAGKSSSMSTDVQEAIGQNIKTISSGAIKIEKGVDKKVQQDTEQAKKDGARGDALKQLQNDSNDLSRTMNSALETLITLISGPVNRALSALTHAFKALTQGFLEFMTAHFEDIDPALPYLFDTQEEIAAKIKENNQQLASAAQRLSEAENTTVTSEFDTGQEQSYARSAVEALKRKSEGLKKASKMQGLPTDEEKPKEEVKNTKEIKLPAEVVDKKTEKTKTVVEQGDTSPKTAQPAAAAAAKAPTASNASSGKVDINLPINAPKQNKDAQSSPNKPNAGANPKKSPDMGFKLGGITSGPESGYNELLHGMEAIIPLPSGMNIPVSFKNLPTDISPKRDTLLTHTDELTSILENYMENLSSKIETSNKSEPVIQKQPKITPALLEMVSSKMDALLDRMKENTSLQNELLQISKA